MRPCALRVWALALMGIVAAATLPKVFAAQSEEVTLPPGQAAEEKEACTRNLKVIYDAIQAYQFDHKDLPNWLSDLVPEYLSDGNVLICPVCRRTGRTESPPLADPKLACSYVFEFSPVPIGASLLGEPRHTRREWKRRQMGLVGSAVPLVRCRHHNPMLNLGFNGTIYESPGQWELMFTNRIRASELSARAIFGVSSGADQEFPSPVTNVGREPLPRDTPGPIRPIDLKAFFNSNLEEAWQGIPGDDLASCPKGKQTFAGVEFDIRGIVQLKGNSDSLSKFPSEIKGIPVRQRCQHLYFLHAAMVGAGVDSGDQIGAYVVHLPKTQLTLEIPIYYGKSVLNWHRDQTDPEPDKELKVAWTGENAVSKRTGKQVRLFVTSWNLAPGVEVDSLDFVSAGKNAAPFLLAISVD